MKEFLAPLGKRIIVLIAVKPMVGKAGNGDVDARGYALSRKRPGVP